MMMHAYNELYLNSAMETLGEVFSFTSNPIEADLFFEEFLMSGYAYQFGRGNPKYINMPSFALFKDIVKDKLPLTTLYSNEKTPEYWCGFVLAYYQWYTGLTFQQIGEKIKPSRIISMYNPLHEADLSKFVEVANGIVFDKETNLSKYRRIAKLSQSELSRLSNVSLRAIQLYEQRKLDINSASAIKLFKISRVLGCNIEDLLEMI